MTWQGKRRKQLPGNWGTIRKQVLERDGYRCTYVHTPNQTFDFERLRALDTELARQRYVLDTLAGRCAATATEVHHVNGPTDHRLESLRSICAAHHNEETQREAKAAQAKVGRRRPIAKHPGLA